jgi:hypothetical protein
MTIETIRTNEERRRISSGNFHLDEFSLTSIHSAFLKRFSAQWIVYLRTLAIESTKCVPSPSPLNKNNVFPLNRTKYCVQKNRSRRATKPACWKDVRRERERERERERNTLTGRRPSEVGKANVPWRSRWRKHIRIHEIFTTLTLPEFSPPNGRTYFLLQVDGFLDFLFPHILFMQQLHPQKERTHSRETQLNGNKEKMKCEQGREKERGREGERGRGRENVRELYFDDTSSKKGIFGCVDLTSNNSAKGKMLIKERK